MDSLDQLYRRAELRGTWDHVQTDNIRVLKLDRARAITIDGQRLEGAVFHRANGRWVEGEPLGPAQAGRFAGPDRRRVSAAVPLRPAGRRGGSGPGTISAGFCPLSSRRHLTKAASQGERGRSGHLQPDLVYDPASNLWIRRALPGLPLQWTADQITLAGRSFPASSNTVALIYPNPSIPCTMWF